MRRGHLAGRWLLLLVAGQSSASEIAGTDGSTLPTRPNELMQPSPDDPVANNATELASAIASAARVSVHVRGHILLGDAAPLFVTKIVINAGQSVTLWSVDGATLDAQGMGRAITVFNGGQLVLQHVDVTGGYTRAAASGGGCMWVQFPTSYLEMANSTISNCTTLGQEGGGGLFVSGGTVVMYDVTLSDCVTLRAGNSRAGGLGVRLGSVFLLDVNFQNTRAISDWGDAYGGGLAVWDVGVVSVRKASFTLTHALSMSNAAFGGGIGVAGGTALISDAAFFQTSTQSRSWQSFGGGAGMRGGVAVFRRASFVMTGTHSSEFQSWGGAIGMDVGGAISVFDSTILGTRASGVMAGGGALGMLYGVLDLYNVSIAAVAVDSANASAALGVVLFAQPPAILTTTLVRITQNCAPNSTEPLIATGIEARSAGPMLLRNLTLEAPTCAVPVHEFVHLLQCGDTSVGMVSVCGVAAVCSTDTSARVPSPLCACPANDEKHDEYVKWVPSPRAETAQLAPYTFGCDQPPLDSLSLNRNHWRLSNKTRDIRVCVPGLEWTPAMPTPCLGGLGSSGASGYCAPGLTGPLCNICEDDDYYFDEDYLFDGESACKVCPAKGAAGLTLPLFLFFALAALIGLLYVGWGWLRHHSSVRSQRFVHAVERISLLGARFGGTAKAKAAIGYYQVILQMPEVYGVPMPPEYHKAMKVVSWMQFNWFSISVDASCLGDFGERIRIKALTPLLALLLLMLSGALISVGRAMLTRRQRLSHSTLSSSATPPNEPTAKETALEAARHGALLTLPLTLFALFALVPSIGSRIFSTFSCARFGYDDSLHLNRFFLYADLGVECEGAEYAHYQLIAVGLIFLWPLGVPAFFLTLLLSSRRHWKASESSEWSTSLSRAISFLHAEYRPEYFYWELVELMRKLTLTGFLLLIPQRLTLLRLVAAILLTNAHLVLLQAAAPYKQASTAFVAVATSLTLACTLVAALLIKMYDELPAEMIFDFFGFDSAFPLTVIILFFNFGVLFLAFTLFALQVRVERRALLKRRLRYVSSHEEVRAPFIAGPLDFHLFLSHVWGTGQDQMRVVKQRLREMVPELRVFLDVDDLKEIGDLEMHVERSHTVLVFCSHGYADSKNCVRELRHATAKRKPLIALLEVEAKHGGVSQPQMCEQLMAAEARFPFWGLPERGSAAGTAPGGVALATALFASEPIEWARIGAFQDVTLRLIAERVVSTSAWPSSPYGFVASPTALSLARDSSQVSLARRPAEEMYIKGELAHARSSLLPPAEHRFHLYVSRLNVGASALAAEVATSRSLPLVWTERPEELARAESMLVYLHGQTWAGSGAEGGVGLLGGLAEGRADGGGGAESTRSVESALGGFAEEVERAMRGGVRLLLAHESPGLGGQEARGAVRFDTFFERGQTPSSLLAAGVYSSLAVPLKGGAWRETSMALLANAIAEGHLDDEAIKGRAGLFDLGWMSGRLLQSAKLSVRSVRLQIGGRSRKSRNSDRESRGEGGGSADAAGGSRRGMLSDHEPSGRSDGVERADGAGDARKLPRPSATGRSGKGRVGFSEVEVMVNGEL